MATKKQTAQDVDPYTTVETLRAALDDAGIVIPSLRVDPQMEQLIELGRLRVDVALRLADALRRGGPTE